jgi:hypothetical protein
MVRTATSTGRGRPCPTRPLRFVLATTAPIRRCAVSPALDRMLTYAAPTFR